MQEPENAHARRCKCGQQGTVFKLAHDIGKNVVALHPMIDAKAHFGVCCGQKQRQCGWALPRCVVPFGPMRQTKPLQWRVTQRVAVYPYVVVGGSGSVGQDQIQTVKSQIGQQIGKFTVMAFESEVVSGSERGASSLGMATWATHPKCPL